MKNNVIEFPLNLAMEAKLDAMRDLYYGLIEEGRLDAADTVIAVLNAMDIKIEEVNA